MKQYLNQLKTLVECDYSQLSFGLQFKDKAYEKYYNKLFLQLNIQSLLLIEVFKTIMELSITYLTYTEFNSILYGTIFILLSGVNLIIMVSLIKQSRMSDSFKVLQTLAFQSLYLRIFIIDQESHLVNMHCYYLFTLYVVFSVQHRRLFFFYLIFQYVYFQINVLIHTYKSSQDIVITTLFFLALLLTIYCKERARLLHFYNEYLKCRDLSLQETIMNLALKTSIFIVRLNNPTQDTYKIKYNDKLDIVFANEFCNNTFGSHDQIIENCQNIIIQNNLINNNNNNNNTDIQYSNFNLKVNFSWDALCDKNYRGSTGDQLGLYEKQISLTRIIFQYLSTINLNNNVQLRLIGTNEKQEKTQTFQIQITQCLWREEYALMVAISDSSMKQQMEDLRMQNLYKDNILASVSHDLKSSIGAILTMTQFINEELNGKMKKQVSKLLNFTDLTKLEQICNFINITQRNIQYLLSIVSDLQDYSQIKKRKLKLNVTQFSLKEVIQEIQQIFYFQFQTKQIQFTIEEFFKSDICINDSVRLKQILINFISNALKFTQKGIITLRISDDQKDVSKFQQKIKQQITNNGSRADLGQLLRCRGNLYVISVEDTGNGINQQIQQKLFKYYSTFDNEQQQNKHGVGLGLKICKQLCGYIGPLEYIYLESQVGQGSKFEFTLYKNQEKQQKQQEELNEIISVDSLDYDIQIQSPKKSMFTPQQTPQNLFKNRHEFNRTSSKKLAVLLVDDELVNNMSHRLLLERIGKFEVLDEAYTAEQALQKVKDQHFDIVFLDVTLPDENGIQCLKKIKKYDKSIAVYIVTAFTDLDTKFACLQAGAEKLLTKPLTIKQLREIF